MIRVQTYTWDPVKNEKLAEPSIVIKIQSKEDLKALQVLLNRSLNCAPEFGRDWFELSDKLEAFLKTI